MPAAAPRRMKILCLHSACGTYLKLGTGFTGQMPMPAAAPRRMKILCLHSSCGTYLKLGTGFTGQPAVIVGGRSSFC